ncbi:MAG: HEAT repeat domain-containing protein [Phycisphaerales bacterium]
MRLVSTRNSTRIYKALTYKASIYKASICKASVYSVLAACLVGCSGGGQTGSRSADSGRAVGTQQESGQRASRQQASQSSRQASSGDGFRSERELRSVAVDVLLELSSNERPEIRANTLEALQGHTQSLESIAALGLSDRNAGVRSVAAMVTGRQKMRALSPSLSGLKNDQSPFVRASVMFAQDKIRRSNETVDLTPLSMMLLEEGDIRVASHAAYILGELGNRSAVPLLQQASVRSWDQVAPIRRQLFRLQVAEALIKLGDQASIDAVRSGLYPSRPEELEATALAVQIIGEVGDRGAIDQLIYLVDEDSQRPMPAEVRLAVAGALAKLGLPEGGFIADEYAQNANPTIRAQAAAVYGRTGQPEHLRKLEGMLLDQSDQVRAGSAGAILEILGS